MGVGGVKIKRATTPPCVCAPSPNLEGAVAEYQKPKRVRINLVYANPKYCTNRKPKIE